MLSMCTAEVHSFIFPEDRNQLKSSPHPSEAKMHFSRKVARKGSPTNKLIMVYNWWKK